jgi:tetratricopeptide (TPR) repeat protein
MKKISQTLVLFALATIMTRAQPARADDFYADRLRAGKDDYRAKRFREAADELRIASFGFLDDPPKLSESLARLALAQAAIQPPADFAPTLTRFLDVERRFAAFAKAQIEPDLRAGFQSLLAGHVPPETLSGIPGLAPMVETADQKITKLSPKDRERAFEAEADREPKSAKWPLALGRLALENGDAKKMQKWAERALALEPDNHEALALRAHAFAIRGNCDGAFPDLKTLTPEDRAKWPMLFADDFVCLASRKDWPAAAEAFAKIPADAGSRKDVDSAKGRLDKAQAAERAKLDKAQAAERAKLDKAQTAEQAKESPPEPPEPERTNTERAPEAPPSAPAPRPADPSPGPPVPDLAESRKLLLAGRAADAEKQIRAIVASDPRRRDSRLALLEAACLAKDWSVAAEQIPLIVPFRDGEEPFEFYSAVVLFETGHPTEARRHLERARPKIMATPYTDYYSKKIFGS